MNSSVNLKLFRADKLLELVERLIAEVAAVHQEQNAPRIGELDEPIAEVDGGEGLAAARGHLDQGARAVLGQGLFQVPMAVIWAGQRPVVLSGGMCRRCPRRVVVVSAARDAPPRCARLFFDCRGPTCQGFWLMETEYRSASRLRIEAVGKPGFDSRTLIEKWQGPCNGWEVLTEAFAILFCLDFDSCEGDAFLLGLNHSRSLTVDIEQVICKPVPAGQREVS